MTNFFPGLARGPVDHESSSVINAISTGTIEMGSAVVLQSLGTGELLARVGQSPASDITDELYGIAVGGDTDGIYGEGLALNLDTTLATNNAGQGVVVVTQGRCLARVESTVEINIGDPLGSSGAGAGNEGVLISTVGVSSSPVIARALQAVPAGAGFHVIAVDVQREGAGGISEPHLQAFFIPQVSVSTTSTTSFEITRGVSAGSSVNSMPWAGTIKRILIGHSTSIGSGFVNVIRHPNGVGTGIPLGSENYVGTPGIFTEKITYDKDFQKGDGLSISFLGDGIGSTVLTITLEVEFDLT